MNHPDPWSLDPHLIPTGLRQVLLATKLEPPARWAHRGNCYRTETTDVFYDQETRSGPALEAARTMCAGCDVKLSCLRWALSNETYGTWGGMTPAERARIGGISDKGDGKRYRHARAPRRETDVHQGILS